MKGNVFRAALSDACGRIGVPIEGVSCLASTAFKRDEIGLLTLADAYGIPIHFFENEALAEVIKTYGLRESDFVKKTIGIGNVAESAALREAGPHSRIAATGWGFLPSTSPSASFSSAPLVSARPSW